MAAVKRCAGPARARAVKLAEPEVECLRHPVIPDISAFCFRAACSLTLPFLYWLPHIPVGQDTLWLWFPWFFLVWILRALYQTTSFLPALGLAAPGLHAPLGSVSCGWEGRSCGPRPRVCDLRMGRRWHSLAFLLPLGEESSCFTCMCLTCIKVP